MVGRKWKSTMPRWLAVGIPLMLGCSLAFASALIEPQTPFVSSDIMADDNFGGSVALDGDSAIVGAPDHELGGETDQGAAYVFVRNTSGDWIEEDKLVANDGDGLDHFGTAVDIEGDYAVVGGGIGNVAYVFVRSGNSWSQQQKLTDPTVGNSDSYGSAVAISGDTIVVGARRGDEVGGSLGPGVAIVFVRSGSSWTRQAYLSASDGVDGDEFGISVAIEGDVVVVGAALRALGATDRAGAGYVFRRTGTTWAEEQILVEPEPDFANELGQSVGISGDRIILGTDQATDAAHVYSFSQGIWSHEQTLSVTEKPDEDVSRFGGSVAIDGDFALVGAVRTDIGDAFDAGSTYLFERTAGGWVQERRIRAPMPVDFGEFGSSVAMQDGTILIGSAEIFATTTGTNSAYPYAITPSTDVAGPLVTSVLPASRSVQVGNVATVFAAMINGGVNELVDCQMLEQPGVPAEFSYQTTDPATNVPTGQPDTPVSIPGGGVQNFVLSLTPTSSFSARDQEIFYFCENSDITPSIIGLNSVELAASNQPIPDVVALAATVDRDGIVESPNSVGGVESTGVFSVATVNVGAAGTLNVSADTGDATLPVVITLCETNPVSGVCLAPPTTDLDRAMTANETATFGVFVEAQGVVSFDPATNRVFVRFRDSGQIRGSTSVAARTAAL